MPARRSTIRPAATIAAAVASASTAALTARAARPPGGGGGPPPPPVTRQRRQRGRGEEWKKERRDVGRFDDRAGRAVPPRLQPLLRRPIVEEIRTRAGEYPRRCLVEPQVG